MFNEIVIFEDGELDDLLADLARITERDRESIYRIRCAIDDGGLKLKVNEGIWSPPMGQRDKR